MPEHPNPYRGGGHAATRVGGRLHWSWRAVDEHGPTRDVLLQAHRHTAAAKRFFRRLLDTTGGTAPAQSTTDKLGSYVVALPLRRARPAGPRRVQPGR